MAGVDTNKITAAATAVMKTLENLSNEERERVLQSVSTLYGIAPISISPEEREQQNLQNGGELSRQPTHKGKRQSVVEFLNEKQPATNSQRIALFAAYREQIEAKGSAFARRDLEPYFASAKLPNPGRNYDRDFVKAVKAGWIHEDGANSYLTQAGETAVKKGFGGKASPRGARSGRKKAAADKAK
ncbi:MAG TPA: hypothetical protein VJ825_02610 [Gemmatimonadaceae bacterium]|nr:hypothetical protein [Gemmatimonadaceae bacterium]